MSDCEFLEICPIFARFKTEGIANLWISSYCKGNSNSCERKKLKKEGQDVPPTLLPNGSTLKALGS